MKRKIAFLTLTLFLTSVLPLAAFAADETTVDDSVVVIRESDYGKEDKDDETQADNPYRLVGGDLTIAMNVETDSESDEQAPANDAFAVMVNFTDRKGKTLPDYFDFYVTEDLKKADRNDTLRPRGKIKSGDRLILRGGDSYTIRALPRDTHFTLEVEERSNYTVRVKDVAGDIQKDPKSASFTAAYKVFNEDNKDNQNNNDKNSNIDNNKDKNQDKNNDKKKNTSTSKSKHKRVPKTGFPVALPLIGGLAGLGLYRRLF